MEFRCAVGIGGRRGRGRDPPPSEKRVTRECSWNGEDGRVRRCIIGWLEIVCISFPSVNVNKI